MKNYKRLMILLGIATGVIVTLVVLMFTLFGLDKVELKFQNDTTIFADQSVQQNIVKEAEFKKNSCVFFLNKDKYIERIEKNNPYIKVINIETIFPNDLIIHCAEREEVFALDDGQRKYYICDEEFKVLDILDYSQTEMNNDYISTQNNAMLLENINILNQNAVVGELLDIKLGKTLLYHFITAVYMNNRDAGELKATINSLSVSYDVLGKAKLSLLFHGGYSVEILDAEKSLPEKVNIMFSAYDIVPESDYTTHKMIVFVNETSNELTVQHVKK